MGLFCKIHHSIRGRWPREARVLGRVRALTLAGIFTAAGLGATASTAHADKQVPMARLISPLKGGAPVTDWVLLSPVENFCCKSLKGRPIDPPIFRYLAAASFFKFGSLTLTHVGVQPRCGGPKDMLPVEAVIEDPRDRNAPALMFKGSLARTPNSKDAVFTGALPQFFSRGKAGVSEYWLEVQMITILSKDC